MYPTVIHNWHLFSEQNYSTHLTKNNFKYSWPFLKLNVTWSLQYLIQCFRTKTEWVTNVISRSITQYSLTTTVYGQIQDILKSRIQPNKNKGKSRKFLVDLLNKHSNFES